MIQRVRYIWFAREIYRHRKCVSMILKMRTLTQRSVVGADVVAGGELSREGSFPNPGRAQHADLVSGHSFVARVLFSLHSRKLRRRAETREQKERRLKHAADSDMRLGYRPQEQGRNRVSRRFCFVLRYHSRRFFPSGVKMHRDLVSHPTENEISFVWDFTICAENFGGGERNENFNGISSVSDCFQLHTGCPGSNIVRLKRRECHPNDNYNQNTINVKLYVAVVIITYVLFKYNII